MWYVWKITIIYICVCILILPNFCCGMINGDILILYYCCCTIITLLCRIRRKRKKILDSYLEVHFHGTNLLRLYKLYHWDFNITYMFFFCIFEYCIKQNFILMCKHSFILNRKIIIVQLYMKIDYLLHTFDKYNFISLFINVLFVYPIGLKIELISWIP